MSPKLLFGSERKTTTTNILPFSTAGEAVLTNVFLAKEAKRLMPKKTVLWRSHN